MDNLKHFAKDESGVTAIEYGLIAAAISIMLVVALPLVSAPLSTLFDDVGTVLTTAAGW